MASTNIEQANLLSDLTGWTILQNENIFREEFGLQALFPTALPIVMGPDESSDNKGFFNNNAVRAMFITVIAVIGIAVVDAIAYMCFLDVQNGT